MELAGYKPNRGNAARLNANESISSRVSTLQERAAISVEVTAQTIATQLAEDRALAVSMGQASAAVSATMGLAKLFGLITDKQQVETIKPKLGPRPTADEAIERVKAMGAAQGVTIQ